ncbi:MAG: citryl-CoA lyase [Candidatus Curtissbacteria bacterium]|nr:citryl-CoA lyase [Candidatus Curtissbacteria bacterium]
MPKAYRTSITTHVEGKPHVYGYDLTKLAGAKSFSAAIYLVLKGEMPGAEAEKMLDAILTISIDHGVEPASVVAARNIYSGGSPVQAAVAGGILALGEYHGGAIEAAMENFAAYQDRGPEALIADFKAKDKRVAGFGHKLYERDPRTERLIELAREFGFEGKYVELAKGVEEALRQAQGKNLPLNIDGIIAALLLEMGFDSKVGKGIFIIARTPGLVAHVVEEATRGKPVRRLSEEDVEYDGPNPRDFDN